MKRLLIRGIIVLILAALCWYLFIKDEHIRITFTSQEPPSLVLRNLEEWHAVDHEDILIDEAAKVTDGAFSSNISAGDSTFLYNWRIKETDEGTSRIKVEITDLNNPYIQKLKVPFGENDFVRRSVKTVTGINKAFKRIAESYRVHSIKDSVKSKEFCAYIPVRSTTEKKAADMLSNIGIVMGYLKENEIELKGDPFLEVNKWNRKNDSIRFDFCFPIAARDSFPPTELVKFRYSRAFKGIKAEFNGNYRISDKAWYYLLDQAERDHAEVKELPVEVFLNDPHEGGDPLKWKAIIYLPLEQQKTN